jgi:hypothetical protein
MSNLPWARTAPHISPALISCLTGILFLASSVVAQADGEKRGVDFSSYDVPLYEQIRNHVKEKVAARLGKDKVPHDRYFIIPFAYENKGNNPAFSHSFITVIRVFADGRQPKVTPGLKARTYKNWEFEHFTVSWLPADFMQNPDLCVFNGFGARLFPSWNKCPVSEGKGFTLPDTIKLAVQAKVAVCMWGPYEITKPAFDVCVKRLRLLDEGKIKYRADDRICRKDRTAINCFHAMAGIYELFPDGGLFGTGLNMWGINGTTRVLIEYKAKAGKKGFLLEPVDVKKDRYGFVYAPARSERGVNDPFKTASAYHR